MERKGSPMWAIFAAFLLLITITSADDVDQSKCDIPVHNTYISCVECVNSTISVTNNNTCVFIITPAGPSCTSTPNIAEGVSATVRNIHGCENVYPGSTTTTPPDPETTTPSNSTTAAPTTTPSTPTTTANTSTSTSSTTPTPTTTEEPTTTTPAPTPTTVSPGGNSTTPTTTAAPKSTTAAPSSGGGGSTVASFFGGVVFTVAISAVGYLVWRFYRNRLDRNYHSFSNPTF